MTNTDQLRLALRLYDLAGPETRERTNALAAVLSAAHGVCDTTPEPEELQLAFYDATKNGLTYQYEGWGGRWRSKHIGADEYRARILNRIRNPEHDQ